MMVGGRHYAVGRTCVLWSCVALVAHLLLMALLSIGMREILFAVLQGARGAAGRDGGLGGYGAPGM